MQVTTEQIDPCKIALTISLEPERVKAAQDKVFNQSARELTIPGFRKGKVPPQMAKSYIDPSRVKQRAAEQLVGPAYIDALKETQIAPFNGLDPEFELVEMPDGGSLVFKAFVPLPPVVTLGLYKGLELERRRLIVRDEDVANQLDQLLSRHAEYPDITDRAAQRGDVVFVQISAKVEGDEEDETPAQPAFLEIGKNLPELDDALVGMNPGETRMVDANYPANYVEAELRGKKVTFTVNVTELRAKVLPEMTEEFVQKLHATAKTEEELRATLREGLEKAAVEMTENDLETRLVTAIVNTSQVNYPDALLRAEMQADVQGLQERLQNNNTTLEQFLEQSGQTAEEIEQQMAVAADRRIRNSLVLAEVARTEQIGLEDADIDRVLGERAEKAKVSVAAVRAYAEKNDQMRIFQDQALTEKILAFLKDATTITDKEMTTDAMDEAIAADAEVQEATPLPEAGPLAVASARTVRRKKAGDEVESGEEVVEAETLSEPADDASRSPEEETDIAPHPPEQEV